MLKGFKGWIHIGRWCTFAFSIAEVLRVERAMRWGWDADSVIAGLTADNEANDAHITEATTLAHLVDEAVSDPFVGAGLW